ncbi:MAG: hypothetical protein ACREFP_09030 [Acetobacteraceae bacterium]
MGAITTIAFLPGDLGAWIHCLASDVQIARGYAQKIIDKHGLKYSDFFIIQAAIDRGYCIRSKTNFLEFIYLDDRVPSRWFALILKSAKGGSECWFVSLYRSKPLQVRSKLRRATLAGALIREHREKYEMTD